MLFRRYLDEVGYGILAYEPDFGTPKRPDFLILADGREIVVEVESFGMPAMPMPPRSGCGSMVPQLKAVRK